MRLHRHTGSVVLAMALALLLALPFALRPAPSQQRGGSSADDQVVVITPHNEAIRLEFGRAFAEWSEAEHGRRISIDWRNPGGTADISRFLVGQYVTAFAKGAGAGFSGEARRSQLDARVGVDNPDGLAAREAWLDSDDGIGIDIAFGGGEFEFSRFAAKGFLVDGGVQTRHPEWFGEGGIPARMGGETIYDAEGRYYGACLASFGICYNPDRLAALDLPAPQAWRDLGDPAYIGGVALADPTKSGSVNRCFEMMMQECLARRVAEAGSEEQAILDAGWSEGLLLIKQMVANAHSISDSASKITRTVVQGDAAVGICIDFYGRSQGEWSRGRSGRERLVFVTPPGGTSISADPIGLLRGAPNRADAELFLDFVLSEDGQRLWNYRVGEAGGPQRYALRRWAVRPELFTAKHTAHLSDPEENPYELAARFAYRGDWTGRYFVLIRHTIRAVVLDPDEELRAAWRAIVAAGGPEACPEAMAELAWLPYSHAEAGAAKGLLKQPVLERLAVLRDWTEQAMQAYRRAAALAEAGR